MIVKGFKGPGAHVVKCLFLIDITIF